MKNKKIKEETLPKGTPLTPEKLTKLMAIAKKKKKNKPTTDQEIVNWIGDYFCDVILPICHIAGYKVITIIDRKGDKNKTFSIDVNFPYRAITLWVRSGGIKMFKESKFSEMRSVLFHEAFHIIHWKYKEYAEARYCDAATLREFEEDVADRFSIIIDTLYQDNKKKKNGK